MNVQRITLSILTTFLVFSFFACSPPAEVPTTRDEAGVDDFIGQWAVEDADGASWLAVRKADGQLDADLLWHGGSVSPVSHVFVSDGVLTATRTADFVVDEASGRTMTSTSVFKVWFEGGKAVGEVILPSRDGMGARVVAVDVKQTPEPGTAPDLSSVTYGEPIELLNGTDLSGWTLKDSIATNGWSVVDGILVNDPKQVEGEPHISYGNLRTEDVFEDFNLTLEVNVPRNGNSGVYLRGIYEIQVMDSYGLDLDPHHMGGIYSRTTPSEAAEKPAGEWQTMDLTLCDRHITVILNGVKTIDNAPVLGVTGGAMTADVFAPGPIYLQGDHDAVSYRNIVLTPILN